MRNPATPLATPVHGLRWYRESLELLESVLWQEDTGTPSRTRTCDPRIRNPMAFFGKLKSPKYLRRHEKLCYLPCYPRAVFCFPFFLVRFFDFSNLAIACAAEFAGT